ncbi:MAG TPA: GAF domain-containing sensor histidine kinase [Solirubrobacteraceae bacterium]
MSSPLDPLRMRRLLDAGRELVTELDPQAVLDRILVAAREVTGARYAALGILDRERTGLERFLTLGVDERTRAAIGEPPRGRGVLGVLIDDPRPLRLTNVGKHPRSYGFPEGHLPMRGFLGVPIVIRGAAWGNLYLTEKEDGDFTEADEEAAVILASWAATAIENARLYQASEQRRVAQDRAVRGFEATRDIAIAVGGDTGLERVLELIVKRGRALVQARSIVIMLRDGPDLVVTASAGHAIDMRGRRVPISKSTSGQVLERKQPERIADVAARLRIAPSELGVPDAHVALLVPMVSRGEAVGVLAAFDRDDADGEAFTDDDEQLLRTFAASAATAVAMARSVEADRLRSSLAAADAERNRWARELHDETLQGLGALRLLLAAARRTDDAGQTALAVDEAISQIEQEIENLHAIISDLRPAALDEIGLHAALETLVERRGVRDALAITSELVLPDPQEGGGRLAPEVETTVYRLAQEALTNVVKHARASCVRVAVVASTSEVSVEIEDDGVGFASAAQTSGFGLAGMRERVLLAGGRLTIDSSDQGTLVHARLPTAHLPVKQNGAGRAAS